MSQDQDKQEETGRLAGVGAGIFAGAQIGTMVIPIPGVGTFAGALIGGALGSKVGQAIAPTVLNVVDSLLGSQPAAAQPASQAIPIGQADDAENADVLSRLERLAQLRSQGLLTEDEFAAAKAQVLKG